MLYRDLTLRREQRVNPGTKYQIERIRDLEALFKNGESFESRIEGFLPKPELQTAKAYESVLEFGKVEYVNLFAGIVNYYSAFLFAHPLQFQGSKRYDAFKDDVDGNGTDLQVFLKKAFVELLVGGRVAVSAALPVHERAPLNAKEAEEMGSLDAKLRSYAAAEILDWEKDSSGKLLWVLVTEVETRRPHPSQPSVVVERFWLHSRDTSELYEVERENGRAPAPTAEVSPQVFSHGLGRCPVELWEVNDGQWLGHQLRGPCVSNLQARTALAYHNNKVAYPVLVAKTEADGGVKLGAEGVELGQHDDLSYLVPPEASGKLLAEKVKESESKAYRVANLDFLIESGKNHSWRSAAAKSQDADSGHVSLKDLGAGVREFAQRLLGLVSQLRGDETVWSVNGFEKLDDLNFAEFSKVLTDVGSIDFQALTLFGSEFLEHVLTRLAALALPDLSESEKAATVRQIVEQVKELIANPSPAPTTGAASPNPALPTDSTGLNGKPKPDARRAADTDA